MSAAGMLATIEINRLKTKLAQAEAQIAALRLEKREREVRERVFVTLATVPNIMYTTEDMEKAVRFIMEGAT